MMLALTREVSSLLVGVMSPRPPPTWCCQHYLPTRTTQCLTQRRDLHLFTITTSRLSASHLSRTPPLVLPLVVGPTYMVNSWAGHLMASAYTVTRILVGRHQWLMSAEATLALLTQERCCTTTTAGP